MCANQIGEQRAASLKFLEKEARRSKVVLIGRVFEQIHSFRVSRRLIHRTTLKTHPLECDRVRKEHPVVESELRVNLVTERDMSQFMGQDHRQASFVG